MEPKKDRTNLIIGLIIGAAVLLLCCVCLLAVLFFGGVFAFLDSVESDFDLPALPTEVVSTPVVVRPTETSGQPDSGQELESEPFQVPTDTLVILENTIVPINDPRELAFRLEGKSDIPLTLPASGPRQLGDEQSFWVIDSDTDENFQIEATLQYITDHVYFWIENGVSFDAQDVADLAETFENQIYPTNRAFFGSEWNPGVDEDPHIYIIYASGIGSNVAGYFSSIDSLHPLVEEYSNAHETFMVSADNTELDEEFTRSVLAHEFQHMIHWNLDRNETSWLNEGFAELASFLNGYTTGGSEYAYISDPDLQLNDWPNDPNATFPHYGAGFLFTAYFLDRFGERATQALVTHPANGLVSVDAVLAEQGITDPLTGQTITANDVFMDWVIASYLQDPGISDSRFYYSNYPGAPQAGNTEFISNCSQDWQTRDVKQYGADYIQIDCQGSHTLTFEGSVQVPVIPADPYSGDYAFWSNKGDESDMLLSQTFDFRDHSGPLTLTYWTWYDIEEDWDYVYLIASTDGENWEIISTPSGTAYDPVGNNYGWAYTGLSGGGPSWIQEEIDLSRFAGQEVTLQFEYITDAAVNGEGLLLDDMAIPEIGYFTDFEEDNGGWEAAGFVRIQNILPQTYRLAVISLGGETTIEQFTLSGDNRIEILLDFTGDVDEVVVVVSGTTRFTRQTAPYRLSIE
jgi:hypothetical protein